MKRTMDERIHRLDTQIESLRKQLLNEDEAEESSEYDSVIEDFKSKFKEYNSQYSIPKDRDWKRLLSAVSHKYPALYYLITTRNELDKAQIQICIMASLGFSERMMSVVLGTDGRSIDRKKRQINKKLFQTDNSSSLKENLSPYISMYNP